MSVRSVPALPRSYSTALPEPSNTSTQESAANFRLQADLAGLQRARRAAARGRRRSGGLRRIAAIVGRRSPQRGGACVGRGRRFLQDRCSGLVRGRVDPRQAMLGEVRDQCRRRRRTSLRRRRPRASAACRARGPFRAATSAPAWARRAAAGVLVQRHDLVLVEAEHRGVAPQVPLDEDRRAERGKVVRFEVPQAPSCRDSAIPPPAGG